jgi:hypothetical protein
METVLCFRQVRPLWQNQIPLGASGGREGRDCMENRPKGGKVQWGFWGAHAYRQGKPGLDHQQIKLKEGVD